MGTQASVKAIDPRELLEMGTQIILGNTYHLSIRPGMEIIRQVGSPRMKLLFDIYHVEIMDGDIIRRIRQYAD